MHYKLLGKSGLRVSEICLGTMGFGREWGWGAPRKTCRAIFDAYAEAGGNFLDTANRYTEGTSERYVGEFIRSDRGHFVLATKYTLTMRKGDPNSSGNHRKNLVQSLEASLKRLGTDYVDLLWLHAWDFTTPVEEVMRALDDCVSQGKVLYCGVSDTPAWVVAQANTLAELRGWTPFVALQVEYSLIERTVERELLPMARALDLAITPWAPLAGGALSGKYLREEKTQRKRRLSAGSTRLNERSRAITQEVVQIASTLGCSPAQVALAWLLDQPGVIIPIVGVTSVKQMEDVLRSPGVRLDDEARERLERVSAIELGFPHEFLTSPMIREIVFGGTFDAIENHRRTVERRR
jgi:aryl-alcohol dehydrogenase-like predicted oxidoreductase